MKIYQDSEIDTIIYFVSLDDGTFTKTSLLSFFYSFHMKHSYNLLPLMKFFSVPLLTFNSFPVIQNSPSSICSFWLPPSIYVTSWFIWFIPVSTFQFSDTSESWQGELCSHSLNEKRMLSASEFSTCWSYTNWGITKMLWIREAYPEQRD